MTDSIPKLAKQANDLGLRVNNLFQLDDGSWQANLRSPDYKVQRFYRASRPDVALHLCLEGAKAEMPTQDEEDMFS
jgi:hypothetical protein